MNFHNSSLSSTGLFVTFEGVEGAGKSTQIQRVRQRLESDGIPASVTREPGGDSIAEQIRSLLLTGEMEARAELLLFLASRAQNVERVIRPKLANGEVVLCDRFIDSSVAYQGVARGLGRDEVARLNEFATGGLSPDITLLLDLNPEIGLARQTDRNRMEAESLEFHRKVREGFLAEARNNPERIAILDAETDPDRLHEEIFLLIRRRLQKKQAEGQSQR